MGGLSDSVTPVVAEQKVKVPSAHCDSRVRTVCADVMTLMKQQARAMSPQVQLLDCLLRDSILLLRCDNCYNNE